MGSEAVHGRHSGRRFLSCANGTSKTLGPIPSVRFEYSSAEGERWLREQPVLKAFESLTGVIRLRLGDQVVEVVFGEDPQPSKPAN